MSFRKIFRRLFEEVVGQCVAKGLASGTAGRNRFTHVKANASWASEELVELPESPEYTGNGWTPMRKRVWRNWNAGQENGERSGSNRSTKRSASDQEVDQSDRPGIRTYETSGEATPGNITSLIRR